SSEIHLARAEVCIALGRYADAAEEWDGSALSEQEACRFAAALARRRLLQDHGGGTEPAHPIRGNLYQAARFYGQCMPAVGPQDDLSAEKRAKLTGQFGEVAMRLLSAAAEAGYFKTPEAAAQLHTDTDLDPLRTRRDFQKLLREAKTVESACGSFRPTDSDYFSQK